jgi:hypothetical protein
MQGTKNPTESLMEANLNNLIKEPNTHTLIISLKNHNF